MITDLAEDIATPYVTGQVRTWPDGTDAEKRAQEIVADFDGWLENLCVFQVKEIVRSIAKGLHP